MSSSPPEFLYWNARQCFTYSKISTDIQWPPAIYCHLMICDWSSDTFNQWQLIERFISEGHLFGGVSMRHLTRFVPPPLPLPKMSFTNHNCDLMMTDEWQTTDSADDRKKGRMASILSPLSRSFSPGSALGWNRSITHPRASFSPSSGWMMYIIIKCTRAIDSCGWEIRGQRRETVARAWKY